MNESIDPSIKIINLGSYSMGASSKLVQKIALIVANEMKCKNSIQPDHIERWKEVINKKIEIPSIISIEKANPGQIRRALEENFWNTEELSDVLIEIWACHHKNLLSECTEWINQHKLNELRPFFLTSENAKQGETEQEPTVLAEAAQNIRKINPKLGTEEEIKLGLLTAIRVYVENAKSVKDEIVQDTSAVTSFESDPSLVNPWEDILSMLRNIPSNDPRWGSFDRFILAAQQIALQTNDELIGLRKKENFIAIMNNYGDEIKRRERDFNEVTDENNWNPDRVSTEEIEAAAISIQTLYDLIKEYDRLVNISMPTDPRERRKLRDQQIAADICVTEGYQSAQIFFHNKPETEFKKTTEAPIIFTGINEQYSEPFQESEPVKQTMENGEVDIPDFAEIQAENSTSDVVKDDFLTSTPSELVELQPEEMATGKTEIVTLVDETHYDNLPPFEKISNQLGEHQPIDDSSLTLEPISAQKELSQISDLDVSVEKEQPKLDSAIPPEKTVLTFGNHNTALVSYIDNRELSTAYWLAWAMEHTGKTSSFPSSLIAAAQSVIWSISVWPEQLGDLHENVCNYVNPKISVERFDSQPVAWLQVACGIYYTLIMPNQGWENWLSGQALPNVPNLNALSGLVLDFHNKGLNFDSQLIQVILNTEETNQTLQDLSNQAKQWLNQSTNRTTRIHRATLLWQELIRPSEGELYLLIEPVASNRQAKARDIQKQVEKWKDRPWLEKKIQKMDQDHRLLKEFSIPGEARFHLINWILEICDIAERWCGIVVHHEDITDDVDWIYRQTREMCSMARGHINGAQIEIANLRGIETRSDVIASMGLVEWIFEGLTAILGKDGKSKLSSWPKPIISSDGVDRSSPNFIFRCLAQPLSYQFELELNNEGIPDSDQAEQILSVLCQSRKRSPENALQGWLEKRDYRFIDRLLEEIPDAEVWVERCREAFYSDLHWLEHTIIYNTISDVEQANLDELLTDQEYTEYKNGVESVQKIRRLADWDNNREISFSSLAYRLERIQKEIIKKRLDKIDHLRERWNKIRHQVQRLIGDDQVFYEKIKLSVESSFENQDISLAEDYLAHLLDSINNGKTPPRFLFEGKRAGGEDILFNFQDLLPAYVDLFDPVGPKLSLQSIADSIKSDEPLPGMSHVSPSTNRRAEAHRAIQAWLQLKRIGPGYDPGQNEYVKTILSYLGFILLPEPTVTRGKSLGTMPNFQHWHVKMSAGDSAPVAEFGSQRNSEYEVIGVWQKSGIEAITSQVNALMQQTANQPAILFYFNYMTPTRRDQLLSAAHREGLPMLVIDEPLLLYLARINDTRLKPMFYCTLPYAVIDPFYPFVRGKVPPEAFKGRRDFVRQLMDPAGPVIIYGGRQLGKSALLRQVEREFDKHDENRFAIVIDIKSVGDPASGKNYQRDFCDTIAKDLASTTPKLIEDRRSYDIDRLVSQLQEQIITKNRKVILLLDEADHFLDADAEKNFYVVHKLKDLMDRTNRQFKIVLAGLYNVQRFQRISNQPLGHFGTIEIGPLDPESGRDLLVQPLHALGYRFGNDPQKEDNSLALHILSFTNNHPGLIQLFGKYLIEHLKKKYQQPARPPLLITRSDIEAVYRTKEVREALRDRFILTLSCDPRYEAITLALILEQWDDKNGFDRKFSTRELYKIAQYWWPNAFDEKAIALERFTGFLDEMCSLGVLSTNQDASFYMLRSPNLIHLIGNQELLLTRMQTLSETTPPGKQALDNCHALLEDGAEFSPITFAQERLLNSPHSGVVIIYGSNATGLKSLGLALQRLLPDRAGFREIHIAARGADAIQHQLKQLVREDQESNFLIVLRELYGNSDQMLEEVLSAIQYCRQVPKRVLRVCFTLDPQMAWQWHQIPAKKREDVEGQAMLTMSLSRWDRLGIRQRMETEIWEGGDIPASDKALTKILDVTGGWSYLLDEYITGCKKKDSDEALDDLKQKSATAGNPINKEFISQLGIYEKLPNLVIRALQDSQIQQKVQKGKVPIEILAQELKGQNLDSIAETVEYLKRFGILSTEPTFSLEPVVSRNY